MNQNQTNMNLKQTNIGRTKGIGKAVKIIPQSEEIGLPELSKRQRKIMV